MNTTRVFRFPYKARRRSQAAVRQDPRGCPCCYPKEPWEALEVDMAMDIPIAEGPVGPAARPVRNAAYLWSRWLGVTLQVSTLRLPDGRRVARVTRTG